MHIANSQVWRAITGEAAPTVPPTAKQYSKAVEPYQKALELNPGRPSLQSKLGLRRQ